MKNINQMTLKEKLGQLIMAGFESSHFDDHAKKMIRDYKIGNIILFSRNINKLDKLITLNKKLYQEIIDATGIYPFIGIDQEGGMVTRIMNGAAFCPGAMTISATNKKQNAYEIGRIMGQDMMNLGINFNLAPSLDVNNNPDNPVIGIRSYSDDPNKVAEFGNEYIKGLQEEGIIATAKHFPGHGDTNIDSHLGLPTIKHSIDRLESLELVPFKKAITNNVKAIMTAHIVFEALDSLPCTLSYKVLTEMLREQLKFEGIIISDCMQMKAIDNLFTTAKGCAMGIKNGLDIVCVSHSLEKQIAALECIEKDVLDGKISIKLIDEKVARILKFKEQLYNDVNNKFMSKSEEEIYNTIESFKKDYIKAQNIADESLTLVKGKNISMNKKTLLLGTIPFAMSIAEDKIDPRNIVLNAKEQLKNIDVVEVDIHGKNSEEIIEISKKYEQIIFVSYNSARYKEQERLIKELNSDKLFVISTRNPYDYLGLQDINNFICLYEYSPLTINTIIKYIKGDIKPMGKLPIKLIDDNPI